MLGFKIHGWPEVPYPLIMSGCYLLGYLFEILILWYSCSMVYNFVLGISGNLMGGRRVFHYYLLTLEQLKSLLEEVFSVYFLALFCALKY